MARPNVDVAKAMEEVDRRELEAKTISARKRMRPFWEKGYLGRVFGGSDSFEEFSVPEPEDYVENEVVPVEPCLPKQHSLYGRMMEEELAPPRNWVAHKERKRGEEISLWVPLLLRQPLVCELSQQLAMAKNTGSSDLRLERLLGAWLSSRDPLTLTGHRKALEGFARWRTSSGHLDEFLPVSAMDALDYLQFLWDNGASGSKSIQFHKTCLFAHHVLGLNALKELQDSARLKGFISAAKKSIKVKDKRRPLTVKEAEVLEKLVLDDEADEVERLMSGVFLFQLFARARWHELAAVSSLTSDHAGEDGFLEAEFDTVKTAAQHLRGKKKFFMIAVSWGVTSKPWGAMWLRLRGKAGLTLPSRSGIIPTPTEEGTWTTSPMSSTKGSAWLAQLLKANDQIIGTHSCKATVLSWANVAGLTEEQRRALGYHRQGGHKMVDLYGRDLQAGCAREILKIGRSGSLKPKP